MLAACNQAARTGRRDHAMLALAVQSGLRVSELTSLTCADIRLQVGPHVHCTGKGRKERDTPLLPATARILKAWLAERQGQPADPLFPGPSGQRLSRDAVERRVKLCYVRAASGCPSLAAKHVTVHTLRHTAAMRLLLAGVLPDVQDERGGVVADERVHQVNGPARRSRAGLVFRVSR